MTNPGIPEISVVIPVYNAESTLKRVLRSVALEVEQVALECIVVLDAPTDNSESILRAEAERHPFIRIFNLPSNSGPAAARREGMLAAKGEFIINLDADDALCRGALRALIDAARSVDADMAVGGYKVHNPEGEWHPEEGVCEGCKWAIDVLAGKAQAYLPNKLIRRSLYSESGAFCPQDIRLWEDKVLSVELFSAASVVVAVDVPVFEYFRSATGISGRRRGRFSDMVKALDALTVFLGDKYSRELDRAKLRLKLELLWATRGREQKKYAGLYDGIDVAVLDHTEVKPIWKLGLTLVRMNNLAIFNLLRAFGLMKRRLLQKRRPESL